MTDLITLAASIQKLEDIEAIKTLKHAYFRCMTLSLREELTPLFTEDVVTSYSDGKYVFNSRTALLDFLIDSNSETTSTVAYWLAAMPEIELTSETTANGTWGMYHHYFKTDHGYVNEIFVYYQDQYRKVDGKWRICKTGYQTVYDKVTSKAENPFTVNKPSWVDNKK